MCRQTLLFTKRFIAVLLLVTFAHTIAYTALSIAPQHQEIVAKPGKTVKGSWYVTNPADIPVKVTIQPRWWYLSDEMKETDVEHVIKYQTNGLTLAPGEQKQVKFQIRIPKKLSGMAMIMNAFVPEQKEGEMLTLVTSVPLYIIAEGTEKFTAEISSQVVHVSNNEVDKTILEFVIRLDNTGNVHLRPEGEIIFRKETVDFGHMRILFPGRSEYYRVRWNDRKLVAGSYNYTIHINLKNDITLEKTFKFEVPE
jgi:hypothetical protein